MVLCFWAPFQLEECAPSFCHGDSDILAPEDVLLKLKLSVDDVQRGRVHSTRLDSGNTIDLCSIIYSKQDS